MGIKLSGLVSGLDTEAIIKDMMAAQSLKKTKVENEKTKLEWKQEKWQELNTKIYDFYTKSLSKMRLQSTYLTKSVKSSNDAKVTVSAGTNAVEGTHTLGVDRLASSQFITGKKVGTYSVEETTTDADGNTTTQTVDKEIKETTKLSDIVGSGFAKDGFIKVTTGTDKKATYIAVNSDTTVKDLTDAMKEAGLNASYDESLDRFLISSKTSGVENAFGLTYEAIDDAEVFADVEAVKEAFKGLASDTSEELSAEQSEKLENVLKEYQAAVLNDDTEALEKAEEGIKELKEEVIKSRVEAKYRADNGIAADATLTDEQKKALEAAQSTAITEEAEALDTVLSDLKTELKAGITTTAVSGTNVLDSMGVGNITYDISDDAVVDGVQVVNYSYSSDVTLMSASDSVVNFNGATYTSKSNTYTITGITFTANNTTAAGENVSLTVTQDAEAVYNSVKGFVKGYNELLDEMNKLYNADSARKYSMLTDEQKEAMDEDDVKAWEDKIKGALLRRDNTLGNLIDAMQSSMQGTVKVDGKEYSLATFGIVTGDYSERGKLHIYGDTDDAVGSLQQDKLKAAFSEDPDAAMEAISSLMKNLYTDLTDKMKSTSLSSALTVYNDKEIKDQLNEYDDEISEWEDRLADIEERYYKQFTAMEQALEKLNQQQSSLAGLLGTSV